MSIRRWLRQRRLLLIGAGATTAAAIVAVLALVVFAGDGGGGPAASVSGSPTAQGSATAQPSPTAQSSPTAQPSPGASDKGPPPVAGEPKFTDSGLGIIDIEVGTGKSPKPGQTVVVRYSGWLPDGTKYLDAGRKVEFALDTGSAIKGIDEGVATMKVGGKRRLILPPGLAYGAAGLTGIIPPNATLTFDVEMLEIK